MLSARDSSPFPYDFPSAFSRMSQSRTFTHPNAFSPNSPKEEGTHTSSPVERFIAKTLPRQFLAAHLLSQIQKDGDGILGTGITVLNLAQK